MVEENLLAEHDMQGVLVLFTDPSFVWMEGLVMAVWGRRPAETE